MEAGTAVVGRASEARRHAHIEMDHESNVIAWRIETNAWNDESKLVRPKLASLSKYLHVASW